MFNAFMFSLLKICLGIITGTKSIMIEIAVLKLMQKQLSIYIRRHRSVH
jgi:hypothetical protein